MGQIGNNSPSQSKKQQEKIYVEPTNVSPSMSKFESLQDQTDYNKGFDKKRFFFGGNVGLQFGYLTAVELAPTVGYTVHRMFKVGISLAFNYFGYNTHTSSGSTYHDDFILGGGVFMRFFPIKYVYLHAEMNGLNQPDLNSTSSKGRVWVGYPLLGFGYNQPVSQKAALQIQLLWNVNPNENSIYNNPIIDIGFNIRL